MVEINQISFREKAGHFRSWVINWFVGINAQDHFFIGLSPLSSLCDDVIEKYLAGFGVDGALGLQQVYLLGSYGVRGRIEFLVAYSITRYDNHVLIIASQEFLIRPSAQDGV